MVVVSAMNSTTAPFLGLFFASVVLPPSTNAINTQAPVLDLPTDADHRIYKGTIKETDSVAIVSPEIRVLPGTGPVCSYVVTRHAKPGGSPGKSMEDERNDSSESESEESSETEESYEDDQNGNEENRAKGNKLPFRLEVIDQETGKAMIRLNEERILADCKDDPEEYVFKIAPKPCGKGEIGNSAILKITVIDTNNHEPRFQQSFLSIEAEEGRLLDNLAMLNASDSDCGHPYGEICEYHISNDETGFFTVTESGILKNVKPLNHSTSAKHSLSIFAEDCGSKRSKTPITVEINVKPSCQPALDGIQARMDYYDSTRDGVKQLAPTVSGNTCGERECPVVKDVRGRVQLRIPNRHGGGDCACDREYYNAIGLQTACGGDLSTVDLLPAKLPHHLITKEELRQNSTSSSSSSEQLDDKIQITKDDSILQSVNAYQFDGVEDALVVPPETTNSRIGDIFTLSFWMKHDRHSNSRDTDGKTKPRGGGKSLHHNTKENILCSSDDHHFHRRHFAVYIRNCKLELLLRREKPNKKGENEFQPTEWRWHLSETCDDNWHHYSINMNFPQLDLFVDGKLVKPKNDNLEILDDWPLHFVEGVQTKLVVGACWHGGRSGDAGRMSQFFRGSLAEMTYLAGKNERPTVLPCSLQCKEKLDFTHLKRLKMDEEAVFNSEMSEVTLKSANMAEFLEMLSKIGYVNYKSNPSAGSRIVSISTSYTCVGNNNNKTSVTTRRVELPKKEVEVVVTREQATSTSDPMIVLKIDGKHSVAYNHHHDLADGVRPFRNLEVQANLLLESCGIVNAAADTRMKKAQQQQQNGYFSLPAAKIGKLGIDLEHISDGVVLKGLKTAEAYEEALRQVRYFEKKGDEEDSFQQVKVFTVRCSARDGHVKSNELLLTMKMEKPVMREKQNTTFSTSAASAPNQLGINTSEAKEKEEKIINRKPPQPNSSTSSTSDTGKATPTNVTAAASASSAGTRKTTTTTSRNIRQKIPPPSSSSASGTVVISDSAGRTAIPVAPASKLAATLLVVEEEGRKSENQSSAAATTTNTGVGEESNMNSAAVLIEQEELRRVGHRLTLEKLAADAPRPSLGGPFPLVRRSGGEQPEESFQSAAMNGTGSAVAIVIVVCVGFLLLLIVMGIMKIRSTHRRMLAKHERRRQSLNSQADGGEASLGHVGGGDLTWDDGGMNIIVNPIEDLTVAAAESRILRDDGYSETTIYDDDDVSYIDDEAECSDDEDDSEQVLPHVQDNMKTVSRERLASRDSECGIGSGTTTGGLEWDDTTLVHSATQPNLLRSQTYRV